MVQCSNNFVKINLRKQFLQINLDLHNNGQIGYENNKDNILGGVGSTDHAEGAVDLPRNQQNLSTSRSDKKDLFGCIFTHIKFFLVKRSK